MSELKTFGDFRTAVLNLLKAQENKSIPSLEEYLRSLWFVVSDFKDAVPSCDLILTCLQKAFDTTPLAFNNNWLGYKKPLDWGDEDGIYVLYGWDEKNKRPVVTQQGITGFEILKHTILFQIADLHRMKDNELKNEFRYLGVISPTGNSWYNFDVFTYLECGTTPFNMEMPLTNCDWDLLASILKLGRIYE